MNTMSKKKQSSLYQNNLYKDTLLTLKAWVGTLEGVGEENFPHVVEDLVPDLTGIVDNLMEVYPDDEE